MLLNEINIKNRVYNYYFETLVKTKKLETKIIIIDEKHYKDLVIHFNRYDCGKTMLSLYHHELMGKINEHEGNIYLMVKKDVLDELLDKIK